MTRYRIKETQRILKELHESVPLTIMKELVQHGDTSTYQHSLNVVYMSTWLASHMPFHVDFNTLVQGAMLHDFYCYDWHDHAPETKWHGYHHPERALKEAQRYLDLNKNCQNIILNHMWPLTLRHIPVSREAWLVCLADKGCALAETVGFTQRLKNNTIRIEKELNKTTV